MEDVKRTRVVGLVEAVVVLVGLLASVLVFYSVRTTSATFDRNRRYVRLTQELKLRVVMSHAFLEDALQGDARVSVATDVYANVDEAIGLCRGMRDGGVTRFGLVPAVTDPGARENLATLCERLQTLRELSVARRRAAPVSLEARQRRVAYEGLLDEILALADEGKAFLDARIASDRAKLNAVNAAIVGLLVIVFAGTALIVLRHRRALVRRNRALAELAVERQRTVAELQKLDAVRSEFIASASHELRTPLTTLAGYASTLATHAGQMSDEQRRHAYEALERQGERVRVLVNNLLDLSQIEQGRLELDVHPVALGAASKRVLEAAPPPPGVWVESEVPEGVMVLADSARLDQVLVNLLSNAYRYGGGTVRLRAAERNGSVIVSVSDNGDGVPADLVPSLFDPFTRGANAGGKQGSGLGLAITRRLVEVMGGELRYEAVRPHGACFSVHLSRGA